MRNRSDEKMSSALADRLRVLEPEDTMNLLVLMRVPAGKRGDRAAAIDAAKSAAEPVIEEIDQVLRRYGGQRLGAGASSLDSVAVTATPEAARALGRLPGVDAIVEDQPVHRLTGPERVA